MSWQACPICCGKGTVAAGFYGGKGKTRPECKSCHGKGILLDPTGYTPRPYRPINPIYPQPYVRPWGQWPPPYYGTYTVTTSGTSGTVLMNGAKA